MTQISQSGLEAIFAGFKQQWHHTIVTLQYICGLQLMPGVAYNTPMQN